MLACALEGLVAAAVGLCVRGSPGAYGCAINGPTQLQDSI